MKIVQLDIQGFRSLKNVSWRPGDLNVVIGPNGSGKSNLLRMLEMIANSSQGHLSSYIQSVGGMDAVVWDGQVQSIIFDIGSSTTTLDSLQLTKPLSYKVEMVKLGFGTEFSVDEEVLATQQEKAYSRPRVRRHILRTGSDSMVFNDELGELISLAEPAPGAETLLSLVSGPFSYNKILTAFQAQLAQWFIYEDIRVDRRATIRQAPISRLEQRVSPDGQNLINVLHTLYSTDRKFKQDINDAMFAAFGSDFDELIFPPAADQRIQMRVRWKTLKREQSTADLSDGTLRFLFLMTVLASPNPPPLIAIDEPETGLHPSMLPIIAEFAVEAATRTQVIFTTHSDQFLSAFRDTRPTVTIAKWENGETTLTTVEDKELAYWVEEYSLGQLFRSGELENLAS